MPPFPDRPRTNEAAPMDRAVTLKDIAKAAGVTKVTVSGALRGDPSASSQATRERIVKLAMQMGYRPDPNLGRLMTHLRVTKRLKQVPTLIVINPARDKAYTTAEPHNRYLIEGAHRRADQFGYRLEELWLKQPGMTTRRFNNILYSRGVDGVIIPVLNTRLMGHLNLEWEKISAVSATLNMRPEINRVSPDHFQHMALAMRHLIKLGYRRIGFAETEDLNPKTDSKWLASLFIYQAKLPPENRIPPLVCADVLALEKRFPSWIKTNRPDVVVSPYNYIDRWLQNMGFKVPEDVGFCSLFAGVEQEPDQSHISGIDQHSDMIGSAAVDLLNSMILRYERGIPRLPKLLTIPGSWVEGETLRQQNKPNRKVKGPSPKRIGRANRQTCPPKI